jgi:cytidylate kinase
MILAIFGRSAVGKTTVAEIIGARLLMPVRHCGLALRAAAAEAGTTIADVDATIHTRVDSETVQWCERYASAGGIVEGRFLDHVLGDDASIRFVAMTATVEERAARLQSRLGRTSSIAELLAVDEADDLFRGNMYGVGPRAAASLVIDTTEGSARVWAEELERHIRNSLEQAPG